MKRVLLRIAYEGTAYSGFQIQPNAPTIQEAVEKAILQVTGEKTEIMGGSRTDAGVHALWNVAVFDTNSPIPGEKFCYALNGHLPEDIRILVSTEVPEDFHPRKCDSTKTYRYQIETGRIYNPLQKNFYHFTYQGLDVEAMQKAAKYIEGTHDFKSFCSAGAQVSTAVRTVYEVKVEKEEEKVLITVKGNGFLYNMVRIIAGTLMEVGYGRLASEKLPEIIEAKNREAAGPTAPAKGLILLQYDIDNMPGIL